jgi:hypothetical protein
MEGLARQSWQPAREKERLMTLRRFNNGFRCHAEQGLSASVIARSFGGAGEPNASGWYQCRCPCHDDHKHSLSLKNTPFGIALKCFAGCPPAAIKDAIRETGKGPLPPRMPQPEVPKMDLRAIAERIWSESSLDALLETYLRESRRIALPVPPTLRCHPGLFHQESGTYGPAMVALVQDVTGASVGIHRTWLAADGSGKAAVSPVRKALCPTSGHAVRFGEPGDLLLLGEGVESTLSAIELLEVSAGWATLSTSGLMSVQLPEHIRGVVIAADNDPAGIKAAESLERRLQREGRAVKIVKPGAEKDFNDLLQVVRS